MDGRKAPEGEPFRAPEGEPFRAHGNRGERKAVAAAAAGLFLLGFLVYAWLQRSLLTGVAEFFR
ncbi:MAG: hypothetical protein HZB91_08575 [Elusimicrobia bacterium]|nr:hypothetical protein [Elusimicrobiota bacterium]